MIHPEFIRQMEAMLGDDTSAFLQSLDQPAARALRVNDLRNASSVHSIPFVDTRVPWSIDGYYIRPDARPGSDPAHALGAYYLQEASAMLSVQVLDPKPNERILDLCAAPGGKSTQIAARMMGSGLLVSNEPVPSRAKLLRENLERMGAINAVAVNAYPQQLAKQWGAIFDAVLVDAPCSGEGMFRREPAAREEWNPTAPEGCARRQAEILDSAAQLVRSGGRLVYSTCTFNRLENEENIAAFLKRHPEFEPEDFEIEEIGASVNGTIRIWPHRARGDGHFAARLIKRGGEVAKIQSAKMPSAKTQEILSLIDALENDICRIPEPLRGGTPIRQGDYIHMLPENTPNLDGIKVVKPGLCLMKIWRSHIQPMPALARASASAGEEWLAMPRRSMEIDDALLRRMLAGEKPKLSAKESGWTLLTWKGLPYAFCKMLKEV